MKLFYIIILFVLVILATACGTVDKIARHDFYTAYYNLKTDNTPVKKVYVDMYEDSLNVYDVIYIDGNKAPDTSSMKPVAIRTIEKGNYLYNSTFRRNSFDIDLTMALLKYRPPQKNVPGQLNANLNAALYAGLRKDYFHVVSKSSPLDKIHSELKHFGFDAGLFAGIGITPVNSTVTNNNTELEYDGIVFEKGVAVYFGIDFLTFGISLGFDNLLDTNHKYWIYNQKPWIGLMLGVANF